MCIVLCVWCMSVSVVCMCVYKGQVMGVCAVSGRVWGDVGSGRRVGVPVTSPLLLMQDNPQDTSVNVSI